MNQGRKHQQKGIETESIVTHELIKRGYTVSQPVFGDGRYDLIVDDGDSLHRVQVKSFYRPSGKEKTIKIDFDTSIYNSDGEVTKTYYSDDEIDAFVTYVPNRESLLWIPIEEAGKTSITLSYRDAEKYDNRIVHTVRFAEEYEVET